MRTQLICVYVLLAFVCNSDMLASYDFMISLFFAACCCIVCAMTAKEIDSIFAELFLVFQALALVNYAAMGMSYAWFDGYFLSNLNDINTALLITDIICLIGVALGDRRCFNRLG